MRKLPLVLLTAAGCAAGPAAAEQGCEVRYVEFDGGHSVPANVARQAVAFWLGR